MTKKLICLLLAAFLLVSLIALFAACRSGGDTQEPTSGSTLLSSPDSAGTTTDAFSPEAPTENAEE